MKNCLRRLRVFDDFYSFIHFFFGFLSTLLNISLEASIIFVAYQYYEKESIKSKKGDFIEFCIGLVLGAITKHFLF